MKELIYSINGKILKYSFGIYVKSSSGFGALKRKQPTDFNFPDQHGDSWDLSEPYFESRDITLECWMSAPNWGKLYENFNAFKAELMKPGQQRLLIQYPPIAKDREYRVIMMDGIDLNARIKDGKVFAEFSIKLKEINPLKKVLVYYGQGSPVLRYNCPTETEIFTSYGDVITANGNVDTRMNFMFNTPWDLNNYNGRNLLAKTWETKVYDTGVVVKPVQAYLHGNRRVFLRVDNAFTDGGNTSNFMVEFKPFASSLPSIFILYDSELMSDESEKVKAVDLALTSYTVIFHNVDLDNTPNGGELTIYNISLTLGMVDYYSPAPEDVKTVVIAGDISKITNLYFEGQTLWTEL